MTKPTISLLYGSDSFDLPYDPDLFEVLEPASAGGAALDDAGLRRALNEPFHSPPLEELVEPGGRVVVVVPDATRAAGTKVVAALLLEKLHAHGVGKKDVSFLIGGGTHRPPTDEEVRALLGAEVPGDYPLFVHRARDEASVVRVGTTRRGTPVELNRLLVEAAHVVIVGAIGFHYFAGFSGGRKAVMPGCASERSIQQNHLLAFDLQTLGRSKGVASGRLDGNPVHEDMEEGAGFVAPRFMVNTVVNGRNEIAGLYAGHWRDAHRRGCDEYAASHSVAVGSRRRLVVVSCGGAPRDINLIQSHKAMEHASAVLEEGGTMVALARCTEGLGRPDFMDWFVPGGSRGTALKLIGDYRINGQTAWALRSKAERFRILLVSDLDPALVRSMGLEPYADLASAMRQVEPEPGYVIPNGIGTLPSVAGAGAPARLPLAAEPAPA